MNKLHKSLLVGLGAVVLSTVAIQASDFVRGIEGNLAGLALESELACPVGSTQILLGKYSICVDVYEASAGTLCPFTTPESQQETQGNANESTCVPESKPEVVPWRFVSLTQAQQLCARIGKRLPTNEEWYKIVSGITSQESCVINSENSEAKETGSNSCTTPGGVHDMVGNVWEWVEGEVRDGTYDNRPLPASGYVALVDTTGVVLETAQTGSAEYGEDYAQTDISGVRGIIRGGFYGSKSDAGIYAQNLSVPLNFRSAGVGFRCVRDI